MSSSYVSGYSYLQHNNHSDDEEDQSLFEEIVDGALDDLFDKWFDIEPDDTDREYCSSLGGYSSTTYYCLKFMECGKYDTKNTIEMRKDRFIESEKSTRSLGNGASIPEGRYIGKLNAIELPAGNYEFYKYGIQIVHRYTEHRYYYDSEGRCHYDPVDEYYPEDFRPVKLFSWKFYVEPGIAKYLGNVNVHNYITDDCRTSKTMGGLCCEITINNEQARDLKIVAEKYINLNIEDIKIEILQDCSGDITDD